MLPVSAPTKMPALHLQLHLMQTLLNSNSPHMSATLRSALEAEIRNLAHAAEVEFQLRRVTEIPSRDGSGGRCLAVHANAADYRIATEWLWRDRQMHKIARATRLVQTYPCLNDLQGTGDEDAAGFSEGDDLIEKFGIVETERHRVTSEMAFCPTKAMRDIYGWRPLGGDQVRGPRDVDPEE